MITDAKLNDLLIRIQKSSKETLVSRTECFDGVFPGDEPDEKWKDLSISDGPVLRAAVRLGLLEEKFTRWRPSFPDEYCPNGGDYFVTLTGLGTERLIRLNEPKMRKALSQVVANLPTIVVSVMTALAVSWAVYKLGAPKP